MSAAPGADAEADAYFESLIARVDQAVAGDSTDGASEEQSPLWFQMLNYHSQVYAFKTDLIHFP